ncbi:hypothetical protein DAEQUDRAFT_699552 [Daedalea quercina L-15889]|uniref:Uncharacterized protein n=1 Tax=Daedalea quercina L-15889 TaxID=1314783 RepID=A0A165L3U0_9APHY|nr:hypothetical protein DAEQUDRAFT_699552 [Daedalea quercina L-15889]
MASERVDNATPTAERHGQTSVRPLSQERSAQTGDLSAAFASISRRTLRYEHQIKDLEGRLTVNMSNSRAISNLLQEVLSGLHQSQRRADVALNTTVPHIEQSLAEDLDALSYLDGHLPRVQQQVHDIRHVYDRGRDKARELIAELEWLDTPLSARLRTIIFTSNAPVSSQWKAIVRTLFALALLACIWIAWITLRGAVRAHRQRLVWGERLMS